MRLWGLGNEVYGRWQMGHRPAAQYAADAREHALFMRAVDPGLRLVAVGSGPGERMEDQEGWTRQVLRQAGPLVDYLSIHLYGASRHLWTAPGGEDEYQTTVDQALYFEQELRGLRRSGGAGSAAGGSRRPLALALDEWNIRHLEPAVLAGAPTRRRRRGGAPGRSLRPWRGGRRDGRGSTAGARARAQTPSSTPGCSTPCSASAGTPCRWGWPTRST